MGLAGVQEFDKFVNEGGVLITLGAASFFPADFGLTRTVDAARTTPQFYAPGPIVECEITNPNHPIFFGYTQRVVPVRWAGGPLLTVPADERRRTVLAQFPAGVLPVEGGHFGANLVAHILDQYHQAQVTEPLLLTQQFPLGSKNTLSVS